MRSISIECLILHTPSQIFFSNSFMSNKYLRCSFLFFFWAALHFSVIAQSNNRNFVISRTYKQSVPTSGGSGSILDASQEIRYFDGLGRPLQNVSTHGSPQLSDRTPYDLVIHTQYDSYGRVSKVYLPYPVFGNGGYQGGAPTQSINYYQNTQNVCESNSRAFAETQYEASPLNRPIRQYASGSDNASEISYGVNGDNEVRLYDVNNDNLINNSTYYPAGSLTYTETKDENGNRSREFKDKDEKIVLKRSYLGSEQIDTYYVYNDINQLKFVLQPMFQSDANVDLYAFRYSYNSRGLIQTKYVPGGGTVTLEYDDKDRLIYSTDALSKKIFYLYDELNRTTETRDATGGQNQSLTQVYYDNYSFIPSGHGFNNIGNNYPATFRQSLTGKITVQGSRVLNPDGGYGPMLYTTSFYDDHYHVIQTIRDLYDLTGNSREIVTRDLRFDGLVKRELTIQQTGSGVYQVEKIYSYDHNDRILGTQYIVSKDGVEKKKIDIAANRYDNIGQLKTKHLHSNAGANSYLEKLEYCYTPRSWLSTITGQKSSGINFGLELRYASPSSGSSPQYNGNVSEMYWRRNGTSTVGYRFSYDQLNRLTNADGINNAFSEKNITYNKNGNISSLQRWNGGIQWDNLSYSYNGNRLKTVTDNGGTNDGFQKRLSRGYDDYDYDNNGNATRDLNRKIDISGLQYNILNLVGRATQYQGPVLEYHYDAAGAKLRMSNTNGAANTKYARGFEYNQSNQLTRIAMEEGQIIVSGDSYAFQYYLKDHLGNVRMVLNEAGDIIQETEYFPFGMAIPTGGSAAVNKYLYNGKEKQPETEYLDFKWRQYDPAVARFFSVDRLSEKFAELTPYQFASNDPVAKIELDGLEGIRYQDLSEKDRYVYAGSVGGTGNDRIGLSGKVSLGLQGGIVEKRFGMGIGYYVNAGSIDIGGLQLDLLDGVKTTDLLNGSGKFNFTTGAEVQLGIIGFEVGNEKAFNGLNNYDQTVSVGLSIAGFKFSYIDQGTYSRSRGKSEFTVKDESRKSDATVTFGESKSIKAAGIKAEGKAEVTMSLTFGKFIDTTPWVMRQDNTKHQPVKLLPVVN